MKSIEFCYWLQGYFELTDADEPQIPLKVTTKQIAVIKNHANLVIETHKQSKAKTPIQPFIHWILGVLECMEIKNEAHYYNMIKTRLSKEFEHVIDSSYDVPNPNLLDGVHGGGSNKPKIDFTLARC